MDIAWFQSRYDKAGPGGTGADYINCPLDREPVRRLHRRAARRREDRVQGVGEGTPYFDGCLPIEVMAERGRETLRFGPMKPVGLTNPHDPAARPYAVVQLRQDNALGTLFNMVGFQTKLKHGEQVRIFRMIPGLEKRRVRAARRPAPQHLPQLARAARRHAAAEGDAAPALRRPDHRLRGLCRERRDRPAGRPLRRGRAARAAARACRRRRPRSARCSATSPAATSRRASAGPRSFQPMNVNFGLFPPIGGVAAGRRQASARHAEGAGAAHGDHGTGHGRSRGMGRGRGDGAGPIEGRAGTGSTLPIPTYRQRRDARHSAHCRRHCATSTGSRNGSRPGRSIASR